MYLSGEQKDIPDIPRSRRCADRPGRDKIFAPRILQDRQKRGRKIAEAVGKCGSAQRAIAMHPGMHYSSLSRILRTLKSTYTFST